MRYPSRRDYTRNESQSPTRNYQSGHSREEPPQSNHATYEKRRQLPSLPMSLPIEYRLRSPSPNPPDQSRRSQYYGPWTPSPAKQLRPTQTFNDDAYYAECGRPPTPRSYCTYLHWDKHCPQRLEHSKE